MSPVLACIVTCAQTALRCGIVLGFLGVACASAFAAPPDSVQARVLRTIQIGVPQALTLDDINRLADPGNTDYSTTLLARSALLVLRQDSPRWTPYEQLLDGALNQLPRGASAAFQPMPELPGFRGKETVLTMVYAMVMSGRHDRAIALLERHLPSGTNDKHAVVIQALRNIGTPRAIAIIQKYAQGSSQSPETPSVADRIMAEKESPTLVEIYQRWNLVPPSRRSRETLLALARRGCDERSAMAAYWLGFFATHSDPATERRELDALRALVRTRSATCGFMERVIALKALALRSAETVERWTMMARDTSNVSERQQIVVNAFARWGRRFAPAALQLLGSEPAQFVQWELVQGNFQTRQGRVYRTYWDIWMPVNVVVALGEGEAERTPTMEPADLDALLSWLESGARPRDPWVANRMLFELGRFVTGADARRFLRVFNTWPKRNENFWVLTDLGEAAAEPLLRYWSTLPAPADQTSILKRLVAAFEQTATPPRAGACCRPDEACLIQHVAKPAIRSEDDARRWLATGIARRRNVTIVYTDDVKLSAVVHHDSGADERWEFLSDCWTQTSAPAAGPTTAGEPSPAQR